MSGFLKIISLLFLLASPIFAKAQAIDWREDKPLTWEDFQGKADYKRGTVAVTSWLIDYTYNCQFQHCKYVITFNLRCLFDQKSSWRIRGDYYNEYVLRHEQLHFDIAELWTRKLSAAFRSTVYTANFKAQINDIYNKYLDECRKMQSKYDAETSHSENKNMQLRWQLFIYLELKNLLRNH